MEKLTSKYESLLLEAQNNLIELVDKCGVTTENREGKVIVLTLPSIEGNNNFDDLGSYEYLTADLKLISCHGYEYDLNEIKNILELLYFVDELPILHNNSELIRLLGTSEMDFENNYTNERFYLSLEDAVGDIKDGVFNDNHELRVQKWCQNENDWVDFIPERIELYNNLEDKSLGIFNMVDAVERMKLIISEDLDGDYDYSGNILEHDDITILMHYIHRNNENIQVTYLY